MSLQHLEHWSPDTRVIEIGIRDAEIALGLRHLGFGKYLGVCRKAARIERLRARHPELAHQLTAADRPRLVLYNNADVLILSGIWRFFVWKYRSVRHARTVAWSLDAGPFCLLALLGWAFHWLSGRYARPYVVRLVRPGGAARWLLAADVLKRKTCRRQQLHFVPHELGIEGFFGALHAHGVRYVVLRWWEQLTQLKPTDDVDLLVADDSLARLLAVCDSGPGILCCDVYSETGLARSQYCGTPYYPESVARRILASAVPHEDLCMRPGRAEHFHSLAYHAVYHKGLKSGLSAEGTGLRPEGRPGRDFTGLLTALAAESGVAATITLEGLHDYLRSNGWGPPDELLARLANACRGNRWLHRLASRLEPHFHDQGLVVFVVRKTALDLGFRDRIVRMLEAAGFGILATKPLSAEESAHAAARTRGGTWGAGIFEQAGGPPAVLVVAYDPRPQPLSRRQRRRFPERRNGRIFVKETIRSAVNAELPRGLSCNALHSSDHAAEAWHLIDVMAPELAEPILRLLESRTRASGPALPTDREAPGAPGREACPSRSGGRRAEAA